MIGYADIVSTAHYPSDLGTLIFLSHIRRNRPTKSAEMAGPPPLVTKVCARACFLLHCYTMPSIAVACFYMQCLRQCHTYSDKDSRIMVHSNCCPDSYMVARNLSSRLLPSLFVIAVVMPVVCHSACVLRSYFAVINENVAKCKFGGVETTPFLQICITRRAVPKDCKSQ